MSKAVKRLFDIIASASGLIVLSPVFLILAYLIRKNLGSPVFFIQERPGKDGKPFKMVKFRSMRDALDSDGIPLPDSERLTPFGKKLRAASLDELPELWNVLKGDMSLVGPRPLLMQYLPLYDNFQNRRHEMRPGITGWAQVNGRNAASWEERFACDIWYIDHFSLCLDIKILLLTVKKVLIKEGISAQGEATMPHFHRKTQTCRRRRGRTRQSRCRACRRTRHIRRNRFSGRPRPRQRQRLFRHRHDTAT